MLIIRAERGEVGWGSLESPPFWDVRWEPLPGMVDPWGLILHWTQRPTASRRLSWKPAQQTSQQQRRDETAEACAHRPRGHCPATGLVGWVQSLSLVS